MGQHIHREHDEVFITTAGKLRFISVGEPVDVELGRVTIPAFVVWVESDGVVDADYGRAYAQSLPNARFKLIPEAGHVPQRPQDPGTSPNEPTNTPPRRMARAEVHHPRTSAHDDCYL